MGSCFSSQKPAETTTATTAVANSSPAPKQATSTDQPQSQQQVQQDVQQQPEVKVQQKSIKSGPISNKVSFGAGCYWGTEKYFYSDFGKKRFPESNIIGKVGFMGPADAKANPSYREVCSGSTGHVEVYDLEYSGGESMFEQLIRFFFQFHDPTTFNKQGNDAGTQYASVIYCYDSKQIEIANKVKNELQNHLDNGRIKGYKESTVTTAILPATIFYPAHEEHQEYLTKNPTGYCNHRIRFKEWPTDN